MANDGEAGEYDDISFVESVTGGSSADTLVGTAGSRTLHGGGGNDTLDGRDGDDKEYGGAGNDKFAARYDTGADTYYGGTGTDTMSYASRPEAVSVNLDNLGNDGKTGELDNVRTDVENVVGTAFNDTLVGSGYANKLAGGDGNDNLTGAAGSDTLEGGGDNDTIYAKDTVKDTVSGGTGVDKARVRDRRPHFRRDALLTRPPGTPAGVSRGRACGR